MNDSIVTKTTNPPGRTAWKEIIARYQHPSVARSVWQIANTVAPYVALWYLMHLCLAVSVWLALPLAVLVADGADLPR